MRCRTRRRARARASSPHLPTPRRDHAATGRGAGGVVDDQGADLVERAFREDMAFEGAVLDALTADEQAMLEALLRKLALAALNPDAGTQS